MAIKLSSKCIEIIFFEKTDVQSITLLWGDVQRFKWRFTNPLAGKRQPQIWAIHLLLEVLLCHRQAKNFNGFLLKSWHSKVLLNSTEHYEDSWEPLWPACGSNVQTFQEKSTFSALGSHWLFMSLQHLLEKHTCPWRPGCHDFTHWC